MALKDNMMKVTLVTKSVVNTYGTKGDKGDTVLTIYFKRSVISKLEEEQHCRSLYL